MNKKKLLICGAAGFIGRNLLERFSKCGHYEVSAVYHKKQPDSVLQNLPGVRWLHADLRDPADVRRVIESQEVVVQAAATTSGAKDILTKPYHHVTDNAVMNSLLFRACHEQGAAHVVFFSCTTMYQSSETPVSEEDFDGRIIDQYFGVGWTKVYIEKMCEFYAKLGQTKYTVIRHTNIYGPHDKFDLEKGHVFGATVEKVMAADEKVSVWGDGSDARDLLYVDDLADFVEQAVRTQKTPFELVNLGSGTCVSVRDLVEKIIAASGRNLKIEYDLSKPSIGFRLAVNSARAKEVFGWRAKTPLEEGIQKTLGWYRNHRISGASAHRSKES